MVVDSVEFRRGVRPTDRSQWGTIVAADMGAIRLDTELRPQGRQVHAHRLVFHSCVKGLKNIHADRAVSDRERILEIPFLADVTTSVENAAQSVFQALRIVCLAANLNVS